MITAASSCWLLSFLRKGVGSRWQRAQRPKRRRQQMISPAADVHHRAGRCRSRSWLNFLLAGAFVHGVSSHSQSCIPLASFSHYSRLFSLEALSFSFFPTTGFLWSWEDARIAGARKCALAFFCGRDYAWLRLAVNCFCTIHTENRFLTSCRGTIAFAIVQHVC